MTAQTTDRPRFESPAELVAIARAANVCGDRGLERAAKRELRERFRIFIRFERAKRETSHAS